jgi:hypothetical protein
MTIGVVLSARCSSADEGGGRPRAPAGRVALGVAEGEGARSATAGGGIGSVNGIVVACDGGALSVVGRLSSTLALVATESFASDTRSPDGSWLIASPAEFFAAR